MFTYEIKQDGWPLGSAKGKSAAVERLKHLLKWEGVVSQHWKDSKGDVSVKTDQGIFTIERCFS